MLAIKRSKLEGTITIPPSKSQTLRALLFASLAEGESIVRHTLHSSGTDAMVTACRQWGAEIRREKNDYFIKGVAGKRKNKAITIDAGNSGILARFLAGVAATTDELTTVIGDQSVSTQRTLQPLTDGLKKLGAHIEYEKREGLTPVRVSGPLLEGEVTIDGRDSQHVSALLIAAALNGGKFTIHVKDPGERPWVALTVDWLKRLGVSCQEGKDCYTISSTKPFKAFEFTVPSDFSSLSFPVTAAVMTDSPLVIEGIHDDPHQGDKQFITTLIEMGANIQVDWNQGKLTVSPSELQGKPVDVNGMIDAIVPLALVATKAKGRTQIYNGEVARTKECDRIACLHRELSKMGALIEENSDGLTIETSSLRGKEVKSYDDHRMAMVLSIAGMASEGTTEVLGAQCIEKTYPNFVESFVAVGAKIERK